MPLQSICLVRHGETEWALTGRHTGRTDIPLTPKGEADARLLPNRLAAMSFSYVFTSPLQRAARTAELSGYPNAERVPDLLEWHYGQYEGLKSVEIRSVASNWRLFRDGCPGGESPPEIAGRIDAFLNRLRKLDGHVLLFAHGHVLRALAARFLEEDVSLGERLFLGTASVSILGYEHPPHDPVVRLWNDRHHLEA